jgi:hypothetical protein
MNTSAADDPSKAFKGLRMLCYDSTTWVRDNFTKRIDAYNEVIRSHMMLLIDTCTDTCSILPVADVTMHVCVLLLLYTCTQCANRKQMMIRR